MYTVKHVCVCVCVTVCVYLHRVCPICKCGEIIVTTVGSSKYHIYQCFCGVEFQCADSSMKQRQTESDAQHIDRMMRTLKQRIHKIVTIHASRHASASLLQWRVEPKRRVLQAYCMQCGLNVAAVAEPEIAPNIMQVSVFT